MFCFTDNVREIRRLIKSHLLKQVLPFTREVEDPALSGGLQDEFTRIELRLRARLKLRLRVRVRLRRGP